MQHENRPLLARPPRNLVQLLLHRNIFGAALVQHNKDPRFLLRCKIIAVV
jgi:hypothetical protein